MTLLTLFVACSSTPMAGPSATATPPAPPAATAAPAASAGAEWTLFGAPFAVGSALPASVVLSEPQSHATGPVRMTGELSEVCQKAGCWAVVRDDAGHAIRITMKDHAFGIAKDATGKACDVEGTLLQKPVDPATVAHYKSEGSSGTAPEDGKSQVWELVATTVAVR